MAGFTAVITQSANCRSMLNLWSTACDIRSVFTSEIGRKPRHPRTLDISNSHYDSNSFSMVNSCSFVLLCALGSLVGWSWSLSSSARGIRRDAGPKGSGREEAGGISAGAVHRGKPHWAFPRGRPAVLGRLMEVASEMSDIDDRCIHNYALITSFAEKVRMMAMMMMTMMILLKSNLKVLDLGQTEIPREEALHYLSSIPTPCRYTRSRGTQVHSRRIMENLSS